MMSTLATALAAAAGEVPTYDVLDGALRLGRRRRRRAVAGSTIAAAAVVVLVVFALLPLVVGARPAPVVGTPTGPSLPDRLGTPPLFTGDVTDSPPPGPAGVVFAEQSVNRNQVITVGDEHDTYRVLDTAADPGRSALLSPDGARLAYYDDGQTVGVVDLRTGDVARYVNPVPGADDIKPEAWLPDGAGLIVLSVTYAKDPTTEGTAKHLGVLALDTRAYDEFAAATWPVGGAGFAVAVSPDGTRIAYQYSDFITVYDRTTRAKTTFTLPSRYDDLAGKAAWSTDGRSLALIEAQMQDPAAGRRWQVLLVDPATGVERYPPQRWELSGITLIRLTGWHAGHPVVIGYDARPPLRRCSAMPVTSPCRPKRSSGSASMNSPPRAPPPGWWPPGSPGWTWPTR